MDAHTPFELPDETRPNDPGTPDARFEAHYAAAVGPSPDPHDNLWMSDGDRIWDLGPAETDTDADGVADSLTRIGPDGMTVYTDTDHDGRVDAITDVHEDGAYESRRLDAHTGAWVRTAVGRLD